MRALLFLILLAPLAQARERCRTPDRDGNCTAVPFFSFAPPSGAGLPSGTKGEVLTTTRASAYSCGTPIGAPVSVVDVADNAPCFVDTSWVPAFAAYSQTLVRTSELENVAWTKAGHVSTCAPTVWANDAGAPDGTETADAVHICAAEGAGYSIIYQDATITDPAHLSVWLKSARPPDGGVPIAGVVSLNYDGVSGCTECSVSPVAWSECALLNKDTAGTTHFFELGNYGNICAADRTQPSDILVWRANMSTPGALRPSIEATSAAVNVAANVSSVAYTTPATATGAGSWASDYWPLLSAANATVFQAYFGASDDVKAYSDGSLHITCDFRIGGVSHTVTTAATMVLNASNRIACYSSAAEIGACIGGVCTTGAAHGHALPTGATTWFLGQRTGAANFANGYVRAACYDPGAGRCR